MKKVKIGSEDARTRTYMTGKLLTKFSFHQICDSSSNVTKLKAKFESCR